MIIGTIVDIRLRIFGIVIIMNGERLHQCRIGSFYLSVLVGFVFDLASVSESISWWSGCCRCLVGLSTSGLPARRCV